MRDDWAVAELFEIAASTAPLQERAQGLVDRLEHWLPVDATWLALSDPGSNVYATIGSTGLERSVLTYLDRPAVAQEIQRAGLNHNQAPLSLAELPIAADELPTWADCLVPAGFRDGLGVPLFEVGGPYLGMLTLFFGGQEPPSGVLRDRIRQLSPVIARGVSPLRSLLATARLVQGATSGAVLFRDGTVSPLPGLPGREDHALLVADSAVVGIARDGLLAGQVYRSFLWPAPEGPRPLSHLRMTVLGASEVPVFVLGTLLVSPGRLPGLHPPRAPGARSARRRPLEPADRQEPDRGRADGRHPRGAPARQAGRTVEDRGRRPGRAGGLLRPSVTRGAEAALTARPADHQSSGGR